MWVEEFWIESFDEWVTSEAVWELELCDHIYKFLKVHEQLRFVFGVVTITKDFFFPAR